MIEKKAVTNKENSADRHRRGNILKRNDNRNERNDYLSAERNRIRSPFLSRIRQGSLTVEACIAVPLFFLCMVTLICLMDVYGLVAERTVKLQVLAEKAGVAAGAAAAVTGKEAEETKAIDLKVPVFYKPVYSPFPGKGIMVMCRARVYPWTGREPEENTEEDTEEDKEDQLVYVTETGSVYHTSADCTHIKLSIESVSASTVDSRRNSGGGKYYACEKCAKEGSSGGNVYITKEGNRYHNSMNCSGLKRNVRLVLYSDVKDMKKCSRCASKESGESTAGEKAG